jgi:hypothetical protein
MQRGDTGNEGECKSTAQYAYEASEQDTCNSELDVWEASFLKF